MTDSEAIEIVRKEKSYMDSHAGRAQSEAFQMAINALEKKIPKKPSIINKIGFMQKKCASCGSEYLPFDGKYCPECGQRLE